MAVFKIKWIYLYFIAATVLITVVQCRIPSNPRLVEDVIQPIEFNKLSRIDQIKKCASCHKTEYENEMKGPHANAYNMLTAHRDVVNKEGYDYPEYTNHVNASYGTCEKCHAAKNLFETMFRGYNNPDSLTRWLNTIDFPFPEVRTEISTKITGIDCITCHYNGKNVITVSGDKNFSNAWCAPEKSSFFSGNMSCYPCHFDDVKTFQTQLPHSNSTQNNCSGCHLEKTGDGKGTHYYYWRYNSKFGKPSPVFDGILNDIQVAFDRNTNALNITWRNEHAPHQMAEGPELIVIFDVLNSDSSVLETKQLRLNRKTEHDKMMFTEMGNKNLRGKTGIEIPLDGKNVQLNFLLKTPVNNGLIRLSAISKAQYWLSDALGEKVSERYISF